MRVSSAQRGDTPRVLHIVAGLDAGGVQVGVANLIERTQHAFRYAVCCVGRSGPVAARLASRDVPVHFLHKGEGHEWRLFLRIAALCRSLRPDVVHTHNWSTFDGVPAARLARVPALVHTEHTWETDGGWKTFRQRRTRRILMPLIDRFMVVSESVRRSVVRDLGLRSDAITLVPNGIDTEAFKPPADRRRLRAERGYADDEILIGTVGRAVRVKNWPALLTAFARLRQRHRGLRLALVGDGSERPASEHIARELGIGDAVHFAGNTDDVASWLACLDVFVLPSGSEAASHALLEAMAMALPVVATDVGGTSELVAAGVTGRLVPPADIAALAEALLAYCDDARLRVAHGRAGRRRVEQHFSIDTMAAGLSDVYRSVL